ncbi:hypothetical protein BDV93DRAFT_526791 [Ceratobasidium sp. AG-I]|nr:hypothetical protein BDV93DRAFT_526791 [Ceratobasidium sp. AG-I]
MPDRHNACEPPTSPTTTSDRPRSLTQACYTPARKPSHNSLANSHDEYPACLHTHKHVPRLLVSLILLLTYLADPRPISRFQQQPTVRLHNLTL